MPDSQITNALLSKTKRQYEILSDAIDAYGPGGKEVLAVAYEALKEHHSQGKAPAVELVDLWTESLQEGSSLFNKPEKLWGATSAEETLDLIGQTTIGPWQITDWNIRDNYGAPYGVQKNWDLRSLVGYCRTNPVIQAKMAADYIQNEDDLYGKRTPLAIQSYFWLEPFLKGEIAGGTWDKPVLVQRDPATKKLDITPEKMRMTGFYGKQILLGWSGQLHGLLYWLWVLKDQEGIRETLAIWRNQKKWVWDVKINKAVPTGDPGGFGIGLEDVKYCACHPEYTQGLKEILQNDR
jgi:hypothetical protein